MCLGCEMVTTISLGNIRRHTEFPYWFVNTLSTLSKRTVPCSANISSSSVVWLLTWCHFLPCTLKIFVLHDWVIKLFFCGLGGMEVGGVAHQHSMGPKSKVTKSQTPQNDPHIYVFPASLSGPISTSPPWHIESQSYKLSASPKINHFIGLFVFYVQMMA